MRLIVALLMMVLSQAVYAQTNIRGWYADGQVWMVWQTSAPEPETYAIYSSTASFSEVTQAALTGRLFREEWTPGALRQQTGDPTLTYRIPDGTGGVYQLAPNEGLFVETVHETGSTYYAVVEWGETSVTSGVNGTSAPVPFRFDASEPVQSHLQVENTLPSGHRADIYYMWADGRDDHWNDRPDFPVMANRHKNGMPSLFIVSEALNLSADQRRSVVHWLHGGQGTAFQSLPDRRTGINIEPLEGYLVAHNDDFQRYVFGQLLFEETNSWWFGWGNNHDPFDAGFEPAEGDTIINYTQRRILWINDWLIREKNADPERVSIQGHSVGSAGTTALAKAFPHRFATATIFNNGFDGPQGSMGDTFLGSVAQNLPTNLRNRNGEVVRVNDLHNLSTPIASARDLPIMRSWHGKNDTNGVMEWDSVVVSEYRRADADGWGMQLWWDERPHGLSTFSSHWSHGTTPATQTERDNAAYQERYRVNQSFPAFYNHQSYPNNADPGDGTPGTGGTGSGDDWGTWGGYHHWDVESIVDEADRWEVTAYLIGQSQWVVDNSPHDSLTSDLAIRKPQRFLPQPATVVNWLVVSLARGDTLQSGTTTVDAEGVVTVQGITLYNELMDSVRIVFSTGVLTGTEHVGHTTAFRFVLEQNFPNPFLGSTTIAYHVERPGPVTLIVYDLLGHAVRTLVGEAQPVGSYQVAWDGRDAGGQPVSSGAYFYRLRVGDAVSSKQAIRVK